MNPPSDYFRFRTRPRADVPPQGAVDLAYDKVTGSFVKRDAAGNTETIGGSGVSGDGTGITDAAAFRESIAAAEIRGIDRLVNYRSAVYNNGAYRRPNILFFGDSMIATATVAQTVAQIRAETRAARQGR